jgi:hypothetical protein
VKQSAADLAARLGIAVDTIASIEARSVVWPDRGVGCPQPGVAYIQVPTEGLFIRLRARGLLYAYHSRAGQAPFYCAQSAGPPAAPGAPSNGTDGT